MSMPSVPIPESGDSQKDSKKHPKKSFWKRKKKVILLIIFLLLIILGVLAFFFIRKKKGGKSPGKQISHENLCSEFQNQLQESREILTELKNDQAILRRMHTSS